MSHHKLSLYQLCLNGTQVLDVRGAPFDVMAYSRFKYGDADQSMRYAFELGTMLLTTMPELLKPESKIFVTSSAYKKVPTASRSIANFLQDYISQARFARHQRAVDQLKIHRRTLFSGDYGKLTVEEREKLMAKNGLYIDFELLKGRHLFVVDDIRITGAHEARVAQLIEGTEVLGVTFLYIAEMEPSQAKQHPQIEDRLNHSAVKSLDDLHEIMNGGRFFINARVTKYILSYPCADKVERFLDRLSDYHLYDLYTAVLGDEYSLMEDYQEMVWLLHHVLRRKGLIKDRRLMPIVTRT